MAQEIVETTTPEWCSECDEEVELKAVFERQKCPEYGADISPCTLCIDTNAYYDCANCILERRQ